MITWYGRRNIYPSNSLLAWIKGTELVFGTLDKASPHHIQTETPFLGTQVGVVEGRGGCWKKSVGSETLSILRVFFKPNLMTRLCDIPTKQKTIIWRIIGTLLLRGKVPKNHFSDINFFRWSL